MPSFETFHMPDAGEGLTEADVVTWRVAAGDTVEVNQPLVEIETAKSLVELPCPVDGVVVELLVAEGDTVEVGAPIVRFQVDGDGPDLDVPGGASTADAPVPSVPTPEVDAVEAMEPDPAPTDEASGAVLVGYGVSAGSAQRRPRKEGALDPIGGAGEVSDYPVLAKPPVRKLARELGVEITTVTPSGPGGLVTREDVEQAAKARSTRALTTYDANDDQPWLESGYSADGGRSTRVPVKSVRKRTAEAMVKSAFTAPHVTVFHTADVTATMDLVKRLKADRDFQDVRVTPLLIVAKALLLAVRRHPEINASWDDEAREIVYKHYVNLGIAASTPRGLLVPNIKDAHRLPLHELALEIGELTALARENRTPPGALAGGTISITNVGPLGIDTGTPILNPGESAILAFGAIREQPWVHEGEIKIRWVTQLALSFDHRLVDGELGARVLADVGRVMSDPAQGLVWG
ncbi:dihydrolipoamide acetyltransferase family protein [Demequina mangrovi]|uniref:Dihydrolipoamide acetyltransferase component of pyruvate dehydrogenase complex n=1 Tax=Demequina mangrovi TaxID=1043493 RepID=A0A1H7A6I3_9MICO|nr:dihydrolipoamide acetyltransferase family protein [Demequina mangrovi]SEJ59507.1 pyruvate dehydrogenase E2 component (dihydrolipoamide acetyltransferase) [Demequina mangrovi]